MAKEEKLIGQARPHLDADEEVLASAVGTYEAKILGNDSIRSGILMATQHRVVFFAKKLGGHELESYAYKSISSFDSGKTMMGYTITFFASGNRVNLKWIQPAESALKLVETVREQMKVSSVPVQQQSQPQEDIIGKIQQLGSLRDSGILTEEEFSVKKAELLAQI
ncbi:PH domain-containing protein [Glaciihabitans sp. UYNi722]|uniref:PH domain-containing protein n=1 Tax=Glaciihabitans sp. UYNi722 TaxID=3156344 RepID=UPI0033923CCE